MDKTQSDHRRERLPPLWEIISVFCFILTVKKWCARTRVRVCSRHSLLPRELNDSRRSLWCEGMSQSRASCPTLIFTAAALRRASRRFYHPENAPCSGMHVPSERRDVNNAATLSAGECRAARGGKVLKREVDGKGVGG